MDQNRIYRVELPNVTPGDIEIKDLLNVWAKIDSFLKKYSSWKGEEIKFFPTQLTKGSFGISGIIPDSSAADTILNDLESDLASGIISRAPMEIRDALKRSRNATERYGGYRLLKGADQNSSGNPVVDVTAIRVIVTEPVDSFSSYGNVTGKVKEISIIKNTVLIMEKWSNSTVIISFETIAIFAAFLKQLGEVLEREAGDLTARFEGRINYHGETLLPEMVAAQQFFINERKTTVFEILDHLEGRIELDDATPEEFVRKLRSGL